MYRRPISCCFSTNGLRVLVFFTAALVVLSLLGLSACSGSGNEGTGRSAPTYTISGTVAGLDEGHIEISNGLDTQVIPADPNGLALDMKFTLDTPLPADAQYDIRIRNDTLADFALQCDVQRGAGRMPAAQVTNVLVRCARVKSVRLLAGKLKSESPGRDGLATDARFNHPAGLAVDRLGNIYVADLGNHTIRRITPTGVVSTFAGVAGQPGSADGVGAEARFLQPSAIAIDPSARLTRLIVADTGNHKIRVLDETGRVSTLAGNGAAGRTGNHVSNVQFENPEGVVVDGTGNIVVADTGNHGLRFIAPNGEVRWLAGGTFGKADGQDDGSGTGQRFFRPRHLAFMPNGDLVVADAGNNAIRLVSPGGNVRTLAGDPAQPPDAKDLVGKDARFRQPGSIAVTAAGQVAVADTGNHTIRMIESNGTVSTWAGAALAAALVDGPASDSRFSAPEALALGAGGVLLIADGNNNSIREIDAARTVTTLAGANLTRGSADGTAAEARFNSPGGLAVAAGGTIYVADTQNHTLRAISPTGITRTLAGKANSPGYGIGAGVEAQFNGPTGVAVEPDGSVLVADTNNHAIRRISPSGQVTTVAGRGSGPDTFSDGPPGQARFLRPSGVAVDSNGSIWVADTGNHRIRRVAPDGTVSTVAGSGIATSVDGVGLGATFDSPFGITINKTGDVFVTESTSHVIRRLRPDGTVDTIAGAADQSGAATNESAHGSDARFNRPSGIATDNAGNVYVADQLNLALRYLQVGAGTTTEVFSFAISTGADARVGTMPSPIGQPRGVAVTTKRVYFTSGDAVLFIDR